MRSPAPSGLVIDSDKKTHRSIRRAKKEPLFFLSDKITELVDLKLKNP